MRSITDPSNKTSGAALLSALIITMIIALLVAGLNVQLRQRYQPIQIALQTPKLAMHYQLGWQHVLKMLDSSSPQLKETINPTISIKIDDMQGRYNLNLMANPANLPSAVRLLHWVEPNWNDQQVQQRYTNIHQWLNNHPHGFQDVSELRAIAGMDQQHYQRLAPLVSTLPPQTPTNFNTLNAASWWAFFTKLTREQANKLASCGQQRHYASWYAMVSNCLPGVAASTQQMMIDSSHYFVVHIRVHLPSFTQQQTTAIVTHRSKTNKLIVSRLWQYVER